MDTKQRTGMENTRPRQRTGGTPESTQQRSRSGSASGTARRRAPSGTGSAGGQRQRASGTGTSQRRSRSGAASTGSRRAAQRRRTAQDRARTSAARSRSASASRRRRRTTPDVVYTPPKPFTRSGLLVRLATVVAVVLALTFGVSIFFKVETVTVSGAGKYTAWQIMEASGIEEGDNLLSISDAKASGKIMAALPYVESARIGIKLPDTVNIEITEFDVVYSIKSQDDAWWLMSADGEIVEKTDSATAGDYTKILGVQLALPESNTKAVAYEQTTAETNPEGVTTPVTVKASEQLAAALSILQYLEANGVIGQVVSVDVSDISNIQLWYGQQYQVKLGDTSQLSYKISAMAQAISQMDDYHTGVLDVSFTFWPEEVGYTPFT